jgi:hypothetical protein
MKFIKIGIAMVLLGGAMFGSARAQDTASANKSPFSFNTDLVTSYVWRGSLLNNMPNLQPYFSYTKGGFQCGAWGSVSATGDFSEVDLSASYTLSKFNFLVTDYYVLSDFPDKNYFDYWDNTTGHSLEGSLSFDGVDKFPLKLSASAFFYGNDKDTLGKTYYSTYIEAKYSFSNLDVFVGFTPMKGSYADGAGVVNAGITLNKEIKITDHFSVPAFISLITNPAKENVFLVAGFTF